MMREADSLRFTPGFGYEYYPAPARPHQIDLGLGVAWGFVRG